MNLFNILLELFALDLEFLLPLQIYLLNQWNALFLLVMNLKIRKNYLEPADEKDKSKKKGT